MKHLVLNELSLAPSSLPDTIEKSVEYLNYLLKLLVEYRKRQHFRGANILTHRLFSEFPLTTTYEGLREIWKKLSKETQDLLLPALTSFPLVKDRPPFYYFNDNETVGFAYAYENELYAISYNHLLWSEPAYDLQKIDENQEDTVTVAHWCETSANADNSADFFESLQLENAQEFWNKIKDIFPNLVFCGLTENQIKNIGLGNLKVPVNKLQKLDEAIEKLTQTSQNVTNLDYKTLGISISGESESTLQQYSKERTFKIPNTSPQRDGIFALHIKLSDLRIHFFLDKETNACYVGYIGKHLPTSKFK